MSRCTWSAPDSPLAISRDGAIKSADARARRPSGRSLAFGRRGCRLPAFMDAARPSRENDRRAAAASFTSFVEDSMNRLGIALATFVILGLLSTPAPAQDKAKPAPKAAAPAAASVNLNSATQAQLETLPGVGAATAKRIIGQTMYLPQTWN